MWVQSPSKKLSFCLIILARVAADTLSANPPFSPDDTQRFARELPGGQPVGFPDSQKTLNVIEKPACLRGKRIADRRLT